MCDLMVISFLLQLIIFVLMFGILLYAEDRAFFFWDRDLILDILSIILLILMFVHVITGNLCYIQI